MASVDIATLGYAAQFISFSAVTALLLFRGNQSANCRFLAIAAASTALCGCLHAMRAHGYIELAEIGALSDLVRSVLWVAAVTSIVRRVQADRPVETRPFLTVLIILLVATPVLFLYASAKLGSLSAAIIAGCTMLMAVVVVSGAEQIFKNRPMDSDSGLKLVGSGMLVMAGYDIVYLIHVITTGHTDGDLWVARGYVTTLTATPLAIGGVRISNESWEHQRERFGYHMTSVVLITTCIATWLVGDYYVHIFSGNWTNVTTIVLIALASLGVLVVLTSRTIRGRARVYLTKVFFRYKYDYRREWLRFIGILSESGLEHVPRTAVRAVAPIVNSPGGIVWIQQNDADDYFPVGAWQCEMPTGTSIRANSHLVRFLQERHWVIDLNELAKRPKLYNYLELEPWIASRNDFWLVVPMLIGKQLLGMIILLKPAIVPALNFEDHDLLRTVGRHVATHIKQAESDKRLAESSQFGAYHRLTAFLMHDMNNLIAQQSLVVKNAERFRHDPRFVDDTIETIAHSVDRMRRLMKQLSRNSTSPSNQTVRINDVLKDAVRRSESRMPRPILTIHHGATSLMADAERLTMVIEHLIRNAQDATDQDGTIEIVSNCEEGNVIVTIQDTGCGMSAEFVSERLFKPFDSTKGSGSMGIGAYQAREYVRTLGGQLEVKSEPKSGTTFILRLPVAEGSLTNH